MTTIFDQADELMREVGKEEVMRMLKEQVRKNGEIIVELTKQVLAIKKKKAKRRRREQDRKQVKRDYEKR